ncbi:hypothetical protein Dsin_029135 [Dipteronia sinensis]|uniref:Putative plant transposon protein domain-containing protein n=1 Tax=Dipteronia sinensis TaxID=43782 RepID=A0AAD9ZS88_9ROSI|nr:hypothetical protein Dsin_029135 [Dipteronia sinensis]
MTRTRRPLPPPTEDPSDARRRKGKELMEKPVQRNPKFTRRLKSNQRLSMVVERELNFKDLEGTSFLIDVDRLRWRTYCTIRNRCNKTVVQEFYATMSWQHFLEGGPVRVRGKNVSFNASDINEWWETQSYLEWAERYEPKGIYQLYNQTLANELHDTGYAIWNTSNMFVQGQLDFKSVFWHTFFSYSLFPSHHWHNVTLGPAILLYLMKKNLPFDCGTIALKRIAEAEEGRNKRLQREMRAERRAAAEAGADNPVEEGVDLGVEPSTLRERRAPRRRSEQIPNWAQELTTMVRDLTVEFRAFKDSFDNARTYTRRTPQFKRKRTRTEGPFLELTLQMILSQIQPLLRYIIHTPYSILHTPQSQTPLLIQLLNYRACPHSLLWH